MKKPLTIPSLFFLLILLALAGFNPPAVHAAAQVNASTKYTEPPVPGPGWKISPNDQADNNWVASLHGTTLYKGTANLFDCTVQMLAAGNNQCVENGILLTVNAGTDYSFSAWLNDKLLGVSADVAIAIAVVEFPQLAPIIPIKAVEGPVIDVVNKFYEIDTYFANPTPGASVSIGFGLETPYTGVTITASLPAVSPADIQLAIEQAQIGAALTQAAYDSQHLPSQQFPMGQSLGMVQLSNDPSTGLEVMVPSTSTEVNLDSDTVEGHFATVQSIFAIGFPAESGTQPLNLTQVAQQLAQEPTPPTPTSMASNPPLAIILEMVVVSSVASALLFVFDWKNGVAFAGKRRGSRLIKWFLPILVFLPLTYWVATATLGWAAITNSQIVSNYFNLPFLVGIASTAWVGWIPIIIYAGATNGSAIMKIDWVLREWIRSLVVGLVFSGIGIALLFVASGNTVGSWANLTSNTSFLSFASSLGPRLFVLGSSAGSAFLVFFIVIIKSGVAGISSIFTELLVVALAFLIPVLIRRSRYKAPPISRPTQGHHPKTIVVMALLLLLAGAFIIYPVFATNLPAPVYSSIANAGCSSAMPEPSVLAPFINNQTWTSSVNASEIAWATSFFAVVNSYREAKNTTLVAQLTPSRQDDLFAEYRSHALAADASQISHFNVFQDSNAFCNIPIGEEYFGNAEYSTPTAFATYLQQDASLHWTDLLSSQYHNYGFYFATFKEATGGGCTGSLELTGPNINITQFLQQHDCASMNLVPMRVFILEMS